MKIKKVLLLMALVLVGGVVQGQNNRWLRQADSCLKAGNCDCAQGFYDTYRDLGGGRDKQIERRIADCEKTTTTTTPTTTTTTTTTTPTNGAIKTVRVGNVDLRMVYVEGGTFTMGCTAEQGDECDGDEKPTHQVTLDGYYIGETEVTQALWREVMGSEPTAGGGWTTEYGRGDNYPAYRVSYEDVQEFIKRLNQRTGCTFRLPTEAEWEYAARGGNRSRGYKYSGSNTLGDVAWYDDNSGNKTYPVKGKRANELGLYDMSGNVWEWCQDWYGNYGSGSSRNPQGPSSGSIRVIRGGSWGSDASYCRVSNRHNSNPSSRFISFGFRLVLEPAETSKSTTSNKNGEIKSLSVGNVDLRMVYVEGGTFLMGAQKDNPKGANYDADASANESPVHSVTLDGYFIGETEVTQALWREVMGSEPTADGGWTTEYGRGDNYPAYRVSYEDMQEFIKRLNQRTGCTFRLPTEAEWEYAARGGNKSRGYKYSGSNNLGNVAWYHDNSGWKTHTVKGKQANELGLYDMSGNVCEWCQDRYGNYGSGSSRNPRGPSSGSSRVIRGGSWCYSAAKHCRVSNRSNGSNPSSRSFTLGFRLVLVP